jgi:CubicO group peptidase (beta-lactamase class C family)/predicted glycoside hydrolase/deacetylase ChbG (UPF0249 family)
MLLLILAIQLSTAQPKAPRLIVRADDMGSSQASNAASIRAYQNGIITSIEVMAVGPWFPEAVKLLNENPGIDVGLHLVLTSEWDNIKWRPLTYCPSLVDPNGYFFPKIFPDKRYPGQSIIENKWKPDEIEQEFRAQIELALRNIPRISHISGHMGSTAFDPKVAAITAKLADKYQLSVVDGRLVSYFSSAESNQNKMETESSKPQNGYELNFAGFKGTHGTQKEKTESFIAMLNSLEPGKTYVFVEHPAFNTEEMQSVHHIGYEDVAEDRQGVYDLFTSERVKQVIRGKGIELVSYNAVTKALPRSTPEAEGFSSTAFSDYLKAVKASGQELHSVMVLRHGKVVAEKWFEGHGPSIPHVMHSVSKTWTSTAVGFAVQEGLLKVSDKVIKYFPGDLPEKVSPWLADLEIRDLLTMSVGHSTEPAVDGTQKDLRWEKVFLAHPIEFEPGTKYLYNSMATYMVAAILQKVTGQTVLDYLYPRLLRPLGITGAFWETSPSGVNCGGWGLHIKTEDMAKLGQFYLQKGKWNGKQLLNEAWIDEATTAHITQPPQWFPKDGNPKESDWVQGYGYQLWRCRHNAFRADGAVGQFIIIIPDKDAVVVTTANIPDMQGEINLIWKYLLPAMK